MKKTFARTLLASSISMALAACGGGSDSDSVAPTPPPVQVCSNCSPGTLTGTVASGAMIQSAEVTILDAKGAKSKAIADANGVYKLDVAGMTAPFLIQVFGTVGGETIFLHSIATADDIGKNAVNVTPLTEMMAATILGGRPESLLEAGAMDLSKISAATVAAAETALEARLEAVFKSVGIDTVDLRTTEFKPDHTGLDKALDGLKVTPSGTGYLVALVNGASTISVEPGSSDATKLAAVPAASMDALVSDLAGIQAMLNALAAQFTDGIPASSAIEPYLAPNFYHDGLNRDEFIESELRAVGDLNWGAFSYQGVRFDALRVERVIDADTMEISYRSLFRTGFQPGGERLVVQRTGGKWMLVGNGLAARVGVYLSSRLKEKPLTLADFMALSGAKKVGENYMRTVKNGNGADIDLWIGPAIDGTVTFGWYEGVETDIQRFLHGRYTQYFAQPDARVSSYLILWVPLNRTNAAIQKITVTGPGLPNVGLTLIRPPAEMPRSNWVFMNDAAGAWNAFNTDRCVDMPSIPECRMNWAEVDRGSEYMFKLYDASNQLIATQTAKLRAKPVLEDEAYARRAELFPQLQVDDAHEFSIANIYNDSTGPFAVGKKVTLNWTAPTTPGYRISQLNLWVNERDTNPVVQSHETSEHRNLYNVDPGVALPVSQTMDLKHLSPPIWVWASVTGIDAFGNVWDHELSPNNPR
ncbi:hypothetical protein OPU71_01585 [Niveibacterium sp. 24ML]|uniref:hypothetical protein n=1 Tax=Niveibacterium sp. 24ML TaxID=2985512 RepID=UPI00226EE8A1|nr:hypothetical protein [Niveibacterium sp. 24ML]MCX9154811.1 hypothetical protein [Niveibacterium sp. 24ML]